eukprot:scaffold1755_cov258-Ochromonas_danica.AAC.6
MSAQTYLDHDHFDSMSSYHKQVTITITTTQHRAGHYNLTTLCPTVLWKLLNGNDNDDNENSAKQEKR